MTLLARIEIGGTIAMFAVFIAIAVSTYWPGRRKSIESHGRIPFEDER
ncbi:MAG: cbb3-type cytochrome c oxidase subunit 3 [Rhodospirillales bacterium]|nr:cbb3-type cytochrome c oxidase subunit 3 [Rhodospirillales bacterium]